MTFVWRLEMRLACLGLRGSDAWEKENIKTKNVFLQKCEPCVAHSAVSPTDEAQLPELQWNELFYTGREVTRCQKGTQAVKLSKKI
jgi:hypothetical protein